MSNHGDYATQMHRIMGRPAMPTDADLNSAHERAANHIWWNEMGARIKQRHHELNLPNH